MDYIDGADPHVFDPTDVSDYTGYLDGMNVDQSFLFDIGRLPLVVYCILLLPSKKFTVYTAGTQMQVFRVS